jgi:hypothetical protein
MRTTGCSSPATASAARAALAPISTPLDVGVRPVPPAARAPLKQGVVDVEAIDLKNSLVTGAPGR